MGIAQGDGDPARIQAKQARGDLLHGGIGAGPDIVSRDLDMRPAVAGEADTSD